MARDFWDDPEFKTNDTFIKLVNPGDKAAGVIQSIGRKTWDDGSVCPQLVLLCDDGEERTFTASLVQAKAKLVELRPAVGDYLEVELLRVEKRGTKELKHLDVRVTPAAELKATAKPAARQPSEPPF